MLSRVLHAVREEIQNREDAMRVEACTQTMETGTQTETIHLMDAEGYTSCCSEDGEFHGAPTTEETQLLNCDPDMRDAGLDDQRSVQLATQSRDRSFGELPPQQQCSSCEKSWPMSDEQLDFFCQKIQELSEPLIVATMDELLVLMRGKLHALRQLKREASSESEASDLDHQQSNCKALMALLLIRRKDCIGAVT